MTSGASTEGIMTTANACLGSYLDAFTDHLTLRTMGSVGADGSLDWRKAGNIRQQAPRRADGVPREDRVRHENNTSQAWARHDDVPARCRSSENASQLHGTPDICRSPTPAERAWVILPKKQHESGSTETVATSGRLAEAAHLQVIEGNPLTAEEIAMFEMFEPEGWPRAPVPRPYPSPCRCSWPHCRGRMSDRDYGYPPGFTVLRNSLGIRGYRR